MALFLNPYLLNFCNLHLRLIRFCCYCHSRHCHHRHLPSSPPSYALSMTEQAKIFRSSPASNPLFSIEASVKNDVRGTAFRGLQSCCFFKRARSPEAARRRTSVMGRRILFLYMAKSMYMSTKAIEVDWSDQARLNVTMDSSRYLLLTYVCTNISWTSPGVALWRVW